MTSVAPPIDPRQQAQAAKQQRQMARQAPPPGAPAPVTAPPPVAPPAAGAPPAAAPAPTAAVVAPAAAGGAPATGGRGPAQGAYGYKGATNFANAQQETGTQYEQDVLAGKYLGKNPYLDEYTNRIGDQFQRQLGRSLSQVSSPFMSGATMGQTGIHGATRAQHGAESLNDFQTGVNKIYMDEWGRERGFQQGTSQDIGQRTMNMRDQASRNYGSDQQFRGQIQSAQIQANSALQQAKMAQALGYDQLAADMMIQYEQLNQQAVKMEQDWILGSTGQQADLMHGFAGQTQYGQPISQSGAILQGVTGGLIGGAGAVGGENLYFGQNKGPG